MKLKKRARLRRIMRLPRITLFCLESIGDFPFLDADDFRFFFAIGLG
jgi:hypothetical protein